MPEPKYEGIKLTIGGKEYTFAPLNFAAIKRLRPAIEMLETVTPETKILSDEQVDAFVSIVHASLVRNYPDMTPDETADLIDMGNIGTIVQGIMGISGFVAKGGGTAGSGEEK